MAQFAPSHAMQPQKFTCSTISERDNNYPMFSHDTIYLVVKLVLVVSQSGQSKRGNHHPQYHNDDNYSAKRIPNHRNPLITQQYNESINARNPLQATILGSVFQHNDVSTIFHLFHDHGYYKLQTNEIAR